MAKANPTTIAVVAKVPVNSDNVSYQVGDQFDILDTALQQLLDVGAVEVVAPTA